MFFLTDSCWLQVSASDQLAGYVVSSRTSSSRTTAISELFLSVLNVFSLALAWQDGVTVHELARFSCGPLGRDQP